ncbi:MAG: Calx-beta domain-containing protein, partial [Planctomycetia bacterium]|nr:Calx-beta domain-containing protein [Planctomycetia bacterium]
VTNIVLRDNDISQIVWVSSVIDPIIGIQNGAIIISRSNSDGSLTVHYETDSDNTTSTPGEEYEPLPGSITFEDGESQVIIPIITNDESIQDQDETVSITLITNPDDEDAYDVGETIHGSVVIIIPVRQDIPDIENDDEVSDNVDDDNNNDDDEGVVIELPNIDDSENDDEDDNDDPPEENEVIDDLFNFAKVYNYTFKEDEMPAKFNVREFFPTAHNELLFFNVAKNNHTRLVRTSKDGMNLTLTFRKDRSGNAIIKLRCKYITPDHIVRNAYAFLCITVEPVNDAPRIIDWWNADLISFNEDECSEIYDLAEFFTDVENPDSLTYALQLLDACDEYDEFNNPVEANLVGSQLMFSGKENKSGYAVYSVIATDPDGMKNSREVMINVMPVNDAPLSISGGPFVLNYQGDEMIANTVKLSDYYVDPDANDSLTYTVGYNGDNIFAIAPYVDQNGLLVYCLKDEKDLSGNATISITATDSFGESDDSVFIELALTGRNYEYSTDFGDCPHCPSRDSLTFKVKTVKYETDELIHGITSAEH